MNGPLNSPEARQAKQVSRLEGRVKALEARATSLEGHRSLTDQLLTSLLYDELKNCESLLQLLILRPDMPKAVELRLQHLQAMLAQADQVRASN